MNLLQLREATMKYFTSLFLMLIALNTVLISAGIYHNCDVVQGFNFVKGVQTKVGFLNYIYIDGEELNVDIEVTDPENTASLINVVGVLSSISWEGVFADPIEINTQISQNNKNVISMLLHTDLASVTVNFQFTVYDYDPIAKSYFKTFYSDTILLNSAISKSGGDYVLFVDDEASVEVISPTNYYMYISLNPSNVTQDISVATSVESRIVKTWGINPVPVKLTSFTADIFNNNVFLNWETAIEVNNYGFEIERKQKFLEGEWETLGFVEGHGNSNSPKYYEFVDEIPPKELIEYRLKQIDTDGEDEYFYKTAEIDARSITYFENNSLPLKFSLEQNYPNPFNPTAVIIYTIATANNVSIKVYNSLGMEVKTLVNEYKKAGNYKAEFNASEFVSGVYFYKIISGNNQDVKKMIVLK